jgi:hypothetical protein
MKKKNTLIIADFHKIDGLDLIFDDSIIVPIVALEFNESIIGEATNFRVDNYGFIVCDCELFDPSKTKPLGLIGTCKAEIDNAAKTMEIIAVSFTVYHRHDTVPIIKEWFY